VAFAVIERYGKRKQTIISDLNRFARVQPRGHLRGFDLNDILRDWASAGWEAAGARRASYRTYRAEATPWRLFASGARSNIRPPYKAKTSTIQPQYHLEEAVFAQ
jgi:hypothetical protein